MRLHEECGDAPADWSQSERGTLIRRPSVAAGVGTYRSSKAKGFRDVGNGQSTVLTNLCAPQAEKFFVPFQGGIAILIGIVAYSGRLSVTSEAPA